MNEALPLIVDSFSRGGDPCAGIKQDHMRGLQSGRNENASQVIHK